MFGIENDCFPSFLEKGDGITNHMQIFFQGGIQDFCCMKIPCLSENSDGICACIQKGKTVIVLFSADIPPSGGTEGNQLCGLQSAVFGFFEEFQVFWIGAGIPSLDVCNA